VRAKVSVANVVEALALKIAEVVLLKFSFWVRSACNDVSKRLFVVAVHIVEDYIRYFLGLRDLGAHSCAVVVAPGQQLSILYQLAVMTKVEFSRLV
jgi:hypothetical protein